jgi:hypothetical protein
LVDRGEGCDGPGGGKLFDSNVFVEETGTDWSERDVKGEHPLVILSVSEGSLQNTLLGIFPRVRIVSKENLHLELRSGESEGGSDAFIDHVR